MNKRSITFRLSLYILSTITLVLGVIVLLNYDFIKKVLIQNIGGNLISQSDLNVLLREMIFVSGAGLIVILLILVFIFRRTLIPLSNMVESICQFTFGDRSQKKRRNEIELLADSLSELRQKYSIYVTEQNQNKRDRRKYEKDLKSAREIQSLIIPAFSGVNTHPGIDLYASLHPAESIGGDLYDYFFIDSNHLLFTMGDVSGKGIPAALFMAVAHTTIKNKATILSAKQVITEVNRELSRHNSNQHFLTLFLGILDIQTGILNYCNAAHNYPFMIRSDDRQLLMLEHAHGLPIGVYPDKSYAGDSIVMREGDMIILYTDGVTDCKDAHEHFYGMERLSENISNMMDLSSRELVSRLLKSLEVFRGETPQADDISMMAIRYLGKG